MCPEGHYNGDEERGDCDECGAGYFCDAIGLTFDDATGSRNANGCAVGHYCESYASFVTSGDIYQMKPCPKGTYNILTERTSSSDCLACNDGLQPNV